MKALHGHIADVKKIRSRQICAVLIEVPIEQYAAIVQGFDEQDVLVTIAPKGIGSYGVVSAEAQQEDSGIDCSDWHKEEKPKGGALAKLAGRLCESPAFREWLRETAGARFTADGSALWVREKCKIKSRAELDHNDVAAKIFHEEIRKPFLKWQQRNTTTSAPVGW